MQSHEDEINADMFRRAFYGKLQALQASTEELRKRCRTETAQTLLAAGVTLIPSDHLHDHEFVVSRAIYEAAKKLT